MEYKTVGQLKVPQGLDPEKQKLVNEIAQNYLNELSDINAAHDKGKTRGLVGSLISGASFHPFFNVPYVGTGIGGAMYDAGQGIVEGQKLPEIAKRAGRGFVIGETVGAVPYVGKLASKTKAGQAAGKALDEAAEKFAQTKAYDALMSEFAPAKEVYKKVVLEPSRKIQQQRLLGEKVNPLAKSEKDVLNDLIADESGQPISFYHGTPNGGFTEFNAGSYFTKNPEYAKGYMHPSASYITPNKTAENPALYEVNIDANKIFDTRNPIEKEIFNKEYQAYYSPELTERGLPDWMEAEELSNWLKEKYPKYDTLIVDEGGAGGYGQEVKLRGEAYIPFSPEQVKIKNIEYLNKAYNDALKNTPSFNQEIEDIAKKYFGTTTNRREAGYILNDGSYLDMSGKKFGGSAGKRSLDHREIVDAFTDNPENINNLEVGFDEFIDNGAVRYMPETNSFFMSRQPSEAQIKAIKNLLDYERGKSSFELVPNVKDWGSSNNFRQDYKLWSDPNKIIDDIRIYFKGGKPSEFKDYL